MRRAEVWQSDTGTWLSGVDRHPERTVRRRAEGRRIGERRYAVVLEEFPTHEAALAHALAAVGLSPTNPDPMEAP